MNPHALGLLFRQESKPDWRTLEGGSAELPLDFIVSNWTYKLVTWGDGIYQQLRRWYEREFGA
ncbi:MAG: hypothetical protein AAF441_16540 [Pseudomonadota bacterium]